MPRPRPTRWRLFFITIEQGGLRVGETVALRWATPTLLVVGEWDHDTPPALARTLFPLLVNSPGKRLVELAEGTHTIMMEQHRLALFETVQDFLEEGR